VINYKIGDATNPESKNTIICHIVNSVGAWGAGFVVPLGKKYPEAKQSYLDFYTSKVITINKDGVQSTKSKKLYMVPFMLGETQIIQVEPKIYVANMIAQKMGDYKGKPPIRYEALEECLHHVCDAALALDVEILSGPRFGAGLSGGDWNKIESIIEDVVVQQHQLSMDIYDLPPAPKKLSQNSRGWNPNVDFS